MARVGQAKFHRRPTPKLCVAVAQEVPVNLEVAMKALRLAVPFAALLALAACGTMQPQRTAGGVVAGGGIGAGGGAAIGAALGIVGGPPGVLAGAAMGAAIGGAAGATGGAIASAASPDVVNLGPVPGSQ